MEEKMELTPKRKSILWNYTENKCAYIVGLRTDKTKDLKALFDGKSSNSIDIKEEDGLGISLNTTGTIIWEQCDGLSTLEEIASGFSKQFGVDPNVAYKDVIEFLEFAHNLDILDMYWRSIL